MIVFMVIHMIARATNCPKHTRRQELGRSFSGLRSDDENLRERLKKIECSTVS